MTRFILVLTLFISNPIFCQVDSAKLDSLAKRIASSHKLTSSYQDSFIKAEDSSYHAAVEKGRRGSASPDTSMIAEKKQEEKRNESKVYARLGITALLLFLVVIGLLRLRKKNKQS